MSETTFVTDYTGPAGLRTRGTVLVVPGRGEGEATYQRFGRRLAADSYRVRVRNEPSLEPIVTVGSSRPGGAGGTVGDPARGTGRLVVAAGARSRRAARIRGAPAGQLGR